jgi:dGTPase
VVRGLYQYFLKNPDQLPGEYARGGDMKRGVVDYIAGMTDNYALRLAEEYRVLTSKH